MYNCSQCSHSYVEQRRESEPQYLTGCPVCESDLILNETIFLEEEVIPNE